MLSSVAYTSRDRSPLTVLTREAREATPPPTRCRKASMFMVLQVRVVQPERRDLGVGSQFTLLSNSNTPNYLAVH